MVVMSPRLGASGKWWARTRQAHGSISLTQAVSQPIQRAARSKPPNPENRDPIRMGKKVGPNGRFVKRGS
jgi:hypothetical protein